MAFFPFQQMILISWSAVVLGQTGALVLLDTGQWASGARRRGTQGLLGIKPKDTTILYTHWE